jgi:porin
MNRNCDHGISRISVHKRKCAVKIRAIIFTFVPAVMMLSCIGFVSAQEAGPNEAIDGTDVVIGAPPLPVTSDSVNSDATASRPRAARPDRGEPSDSAAGRRNLPIPTQPARSLPEIGVPTTEENELPSLLDFIPHHGPNGALTAEVVYTGETFTLARGGLLDRRTSNYRGNLDMVVMLDLEIAAGIKGGRLFVYGQNVHGNPLSADAVGDFQFFSNLDSTISENDRPQFTAVAEYWYEQLLADDSLRIKIGKQDANADFAYSDVAGDFVHSSFGLPPTIPLPTFPSQALGSAAFWSATEDIVLAAGIYDGTPASGPQGVRWGFDTLGHNGAMFLTQGQLTGQSGLNGQLPWTVRVGGWHHNGDDLWTDFAAVPNIKDSNSGGWLIGDTMLAKESYGTDDTQGLAAFAMYSWTRADRNLFDSSLAAGLVYNGLLPRRDEDLIGLGVAVANLSDDYLESELLNGNIFDTREIATELFYKCRLTPCITLQPEMQHITHPGAQYPDALLWGLRFETVL